SINKESKNVQQADPNRFFKPLHFCAFFVKI
ncbi:unnamed protein product, partial [Rotaria sp. Silwood2]